MTKVGEKTLRLTASEVGEKLVYGSVCSGIEAATAAWHPQGWRPAFFSEIEPFPRAVLAHHYPQVPLHGDFTTIQAGQYEPIDLLVGGTPCQSFSIAGLRGGLDDERGNLALEYLRLADRLRPRWLVWENVPGVLSSNGGRDFGSILGGMVELGYGVAYRVLDAQHFGVPQRRRRVFVVGYSGDWRRAAAVLFERHSLSGNPAPGRAPWEGAPGRASDGLRDDRDPTGFRVTQALTRDFASPKLPTDESCQGGVIPVLRSMGHDGSHANGGGQLAVAFNWQGGGTQTTLGYDPDSDTVGTLASHQTPAIAFALRGREGGAMPEVEGDGQSVGTLRAANGGSSRDYVACVTGDVAHTLKAEGFDASEDGTGRGQPIVNHASAVRRLTPVECERLQGFPDDFTAIPWRGKSAEECPDGPRYKALGNSMAVPVMAWIGQRIALVDALGKLEAAA